MNVRNNLDFIEAFSHEIFSQKSSLKIKQIKIFFKVLFSSIFIHSFSFSLLFIRFGVAAKLLAYFFYVNWLSLILLSYDKKLFSTSLNYLKRYSLIMIENFLC